MISWVMHALIYIEHINFITINGIRVDGVRSRLSALDEEDVNSMKFGGGIKKKKTTRKFRFVLR